MAVCETCIHLPNCHGLVCNCGARHWKTPLFKGDEDFAECYELAVPHSPDDCACYKEVDIQRAIEE